MKNKRHEIVILTIIALSINTLALADPPAKQFAVRPGTTQSLQTEKVLCPATLDCEKTGNCGILPSPWTTVVTTTSETGIFVFASAQAANKSRPSQAQCNYKKDDPQSYATLSINSGTNILELSDGNWGAGIYPWYDTCPSMKPEDCVMIWDKPKNATSNNSSTH